MESKAKRILFVLPTAEIGGTRTSLLNLLSNMDKERYQIDVMFVRRKGTMLGQFEAACNVLPSNAILAAGRESGAYLLKKGSLLGLLRRIGLTLSAKLKKISRYELCYQKAAKCYSGKYDCVIAFQEKDATEFARYIEAPRKLAWVHTDFSRAVKGSSEQWISMVFNCFDRVVFVSDACMNEFKEKSHIEPQKYARVYNTFDSRSIIEKSGEFFVEEQEGTPIFVSVGRFCEQKSFDRAVEAAYRLKAEGYKFKWYILGDGELFEQISSAVAEKEIGDCLILTGRKSNPYPYIKNADAMILTSVFESHPMVANEAFILGIPVVSASFPAATESVKDMQNGLLCENSTEGIYQGVKRVLDDAALLQALKSNLQDFKYDNAAIVKQVEDLIEG